LDGGVISVPAAVIIGGGAIIIGGAYYAMLPPEQKRAMANNVKDLWNWIMNEGSDDSSEVCENDSNKNKPSSPGGMQKEVERGQAPRDVDHVDKGHVPGQEPHVHYKDGTSSSQSGGEHDAHKGEPTPSNATKDWLKNHGWTPPN
jgi:hypothetical protein